MMQDASVVVASTGPYSDHLHYYLCRTSVLSKNLSNNDRALNMLNKIESDSYVHTPFSWYCNCNVMCTSVIISSDDEVIHLLCLK